MAVVRLRSYLASNQGQDLFDGCLDLIGETEPKLLVGGLDFDDLQSERGYRGMRVYGKSKGANILFTRELARRLEGSDVTVNALHPGFVGSGFATNNGLTARVVMAAFRPFVRSPEQGADTAVWLCTDPELADVTGGYFYDRRPHDARAWARDADTAAQLWDASERLTAR